MPGAQLESIGGKSRMPAFSRAIAYGGGDTKDGSWDKRPKTVARAASLPATHNKDDKTFNVVQYSE